MLSWVRNTLFGAFRAKQDSGAIRTEGLAAASPELATATAGSSELAIQTDADDYLGTPAVAAYFDAREHEAYYQALKRAEFRRDFHERLISTLEQFIALTDSPEGGGAVDRVIAESLRLDHTAGAASSGNALQVAREKYPKGAKLLGLRDPVTFDSLKTAYRSAARANHPDVGGSHDAMLAVNEAFQFVHALLRAEAIGVGVAEVAGDQAALGNKIGDCAAYRYKCGETLFLIALDDWNLDTASAWLQRITSASWQQSPYANHPWRRLALTEPASKLATRLSLTHLRDEASQALDVARSGLAEAKKTRYLNYDPFVRMAEDALAGRRRTQVVINHRRQADNAFRLGVIDTKCYQAVLKRLESSAANGEMYQEQLQEFLAGGGFLRDLPADRIARGKVSQGQLVPEPGYYVTRVAQLSDAQQAEYLSAFSDGTTLPLVWKYTFVRLVSLVESVLFEPGEVDDAAAEREAGFLASLHNGSGAWYGSEVAEAVAVLRQHPLMERQTRAALLKDIQHGRERATTGAATVQITVTVTGDSPLSMPLTPDYLTVILLPIDELRVMQRTGQLPETEEDRQEQEAWLRDSNVLRKPEVEAAEQKAFAAMDIAKDHPEAAVETFGSHCNLLLELGKSMVHVQELQLGYWIDRLTGALVRLGRFREAYDWLDRYFALPPRYRARSGPAEEERLQKRLARCAKAIQKDTGTR
jgi:hypothetical protein